MSGEIMIFVAEKKWATRTVEIYYYGAYAKTFLSDALQPAFPFLICLNATKLVHSVSVFILIETVCLKNWAKPQPKNVKLPLPADVRRSKRFLILSSPLFLVVWHPV